MSLLRDYIPVALPDLRPRDHFSSLPPLARLLTSHLPAGLGSRTYDVAQAESSAIWPAVGSTAAAAKILVLHDDDSIRYRRIAKQVRDPRRKLVREAAAIKYARFQRHAIREADQVWFVSEPELQRLGDTTGKFVLVSNGATAGFFEIPVGADPARRIVTFVGPATYDANRRAVEFFIGRIWPLVREQVGDAELRLVGEGWGETAHACDRGSRPRLGRGPSGRSRSGDGRDRAAPRWWWHEDQGARGDGRGSTCRGNGDRCRGDSGAATVCASRTTQVLSRTASRSFSPTRPLQRRPEKPTGRPFTDSSGLRSGAARWRRSSGWCGRASPPRPDAAVQASFSVDRRRCRDAVRYYPGATAPRAGGGPAERCVRIVLSRAS